MRALLIAGMAATLAACAAAPESIPASYVSEVTYQHFTCPQLGEESSRLSTALVTASKQQHQARAGDTFGVILIGLPVSSMSGGNIAPEVARLKGESEAVRRAIITKRCTVVQAPASAPIASPPVVRGRPVG
jgi:hypothetical protein